MKRYLAALGTTLVLMSPVAVVPAALAQTVPAPLVKKSPVESPKRVLYIGNSLMYYSGGLQTHTHRIASNDTPPLKVEAGFKTVNITGADLTQYPLEALLAPGKLGMKEPFELVVLAGNSQDAMSDDRRASYRQQVIEFDALIKKHGGKTVLYWLPETVKPHGSAGKGMFEKNQDMMLSVGNEVGALIIPVGLAFHEAYRLRPDVKLQVYDGNHPTVAGQYLAAAVVYATLYGRNPVGNPYDYFGVLDKDTKEFVQKVAYDTVQKFFGQKTN